MNLDDVKKIALATLVSLTNRFLLLFGLVRHSDANKAIELMYANAKANEKSLNEKAVFARLEGGIDELERVRANLQDEVNGLGDLIDADEVTAKQLRAAYNTLLPRLRENLVTVLSGRNVEKETTEESQEDSGS